MDDDYELTEKDVKKLKEWINEFYGKRCPDFEKGCACCEAWKLYDMLIGKIDFPH